MLARVCSCSAAVLVLIVSAIGCASSAAPEARTAKTAETPFARCCDELDAQVHRTEAHLTEDVVRSEEDETALQRAIAAWHAATAACREQVARGVDPEAASAAVHAAADGLSIDAEAP